MKMSLAAVVIAATVLASAARADSIVNISGTANGEQTGGANCSVACEGALINPVQLTLGPGVYSLVDAWSPTHGLEAGALYDAWNFEAANTQGWAWHWKVLTDDGHGGSTIDPTNYASHLLLDVDGTESFITEAEAALFGFNTIAGTITLTATTTLDFIVNDYNLSDNAGGVSLHVACVAGACLGKGGSVPEPPSLALLAVALVGFGASTRRRSRSA